MRFDVILGVCELEWMWIMCVISWSDVVYINLALSIYFTCSSVLLYTNVITHSRYVFVFGMNAILFQVSQHMMSSMLKMERFSLCQGNAMINAISEKDFISYFIIPRIIHLFYVFLFSVSFFHSEWAALFWAEMILSVFE